MIREARREKRSASIDFGEQGDGVSDDDGTMFHSQPLSPSDQDPPDGDGDVDLDSDGDIDLNL
jgi:hypothetical protein